MDKHVCINFGAHIFEPYFLWGSWKMRRLFRKITLCDDFIQHFSNRSGPNYKLIDQVQCHLENVLRCVFFFEEGDVMNWDQTAARLTVTLCLSVCQRRPLSSSRH